MNEIVSDTTNICQRRKQARVKQLAEWIKNNSGQTIRYITARFAYDEGWSRETTCKYIAELHELGIINYGNITSKGMVEAKIVWVGKEVNPNGGQQLA